MVTLLAVPTASATPDEGGVNAPVYYSSTNKWSDAYMDFIFNEMYLDVQLNPDYFDGIGFFGDMGYITFLLYDIDNDGIPELFISNDRDMAGWTRYVFTFRDGSIFYIGEIGMGWDTLHKAPETRYSGLFSFWMRQGSYMVDYVDLDPAMSNPFFLFVCEGYLEWDDESNDDKFIEESRTTDSGLYNAYLTSLDYPLHEYTLEEIQTMTWEKFIDISLPNLVEDPNMGATTMTAYKALYDVLSTAVEKYGVGENDPRVIEDDEYTLRLYTGVVYAELINFNASGCSELIYVYNDGDGAKAAIYGYTDSNGLVLHGEYHVEGWVWFDFAKDNNDAKYFRYFSSDPFSVWETYYTIVNDKWEAVLERGAYYEDFGFFLSEPAFEWYINDLPVSETEFNAAPEVHLGIVEIHEVWNHSNPSERLYTVGDVLIELEKRMEATYAVTDSEKPTNNETGESIDTSANENRAGNIDEATSKRGLGLLDFWSVAVIALIIIAWRVLLVNGHKLRKWVVPTMCAFVVIVNATILLITFVFRI